jgi:hypothetical protein
MSKDKKKDAKKNGKKNGKNTEVKVKDNSKDSGNGKESLKAALEALPEDERAEFLKGLGFTQRKTREKKDKGPDPKVLFTAATEKLFHKMPEIKGILDGCDFPASMSVTVGTDSEGLFFADLKRVRKKYGPRKSKD